MKNLIRRKILLYSAFSLILACSSDIAVFGAVAEAKDTIDIQVLYNGRAWRNLFYKVKGDQFLFSTEFLPGSVTIDGKQFNDIPLKYDIYNDELLSITDHGIILQLNKEMIDLFTMKYENKIWNFRKLEADSLNSLSGYVNVLYNGGTSLYIKYRKEILLLAVENKFDIFNQVNRIFVEKNGQIFRVDSKGELLKLFEDQKHQVRSFIRNNKISISRKDPESFMPVIEYYDNLQH
ncbi:MAG: hypothetical protein E4H43_04935 [Bacteroidia bacterium]|nr:MAG: hypothetical protein E4H43_04935 [Bacteroidia bacterium]